MRALCFGSLNIDYVYSVPRFVGAGETLAAFSRERFSGGKGLNQSIALARAGAEVFHAGAIGADGGFLTETLASAGVDVSLVARLEDTATGHAIIQRNGAGDNCILLYGGANRAITRAQIEKTLSGFSAGDLLVAQNEISELAFLIKTAKERGLRVSLNPSPCEEALEELIPLCDWLILNEVEASQLLRCENGADPEGMARQLRERYPSTATVLTLGESGSICADGNGVLRRGAERVTAVDTTAAGDTYTGYFLAGIMKGVGAERAMELASAAAGIAVTRAGAAPSIPTLDEVYAYLQGKK